MNNLLECPLYTSSDTTIRWMIRRDMPEVIHIEHSSFEFPWCEEDFLRNMRRRNCIGMTIDIQEKILGFMVYELYSTQLKLINFAIHPDYRRQNIGTIMLDKLKKKLSNHRRTRLVTQIRETNIPAQYFLQKNEFKAVQVIREHYPDTDEDAYVMVYRCPRPQSK